MKNHKDKARLFHILDAAVKAIKIAEATQKLYKKGQNDYGASFYAITKLMEIIGEASRVISADLKSKYNHIPWDKMTEFADYLVVSYFEINFEDLVAILNDDIPNLIEEIDKILSVEFPEDSDKTMKQ